MTLSWFYAEGIPYFVGAGFNPARVHTSRYNQTAWHNVTTRAVYNRPYDQHLASTKRHGTMYIVGAVVNRPCTYR
jgi:hypothetical protein